MHRLALGRGRGAGRQDPVAAAGDEAGRRFHPHAQLSSVRTGMISGQGSGPPPYLSAVCAKTGPASSSIRAAGQRRRIRHRNPHHDAILVAADGLLSLRLFILRKQCLDHL
jgi:hypothetical protein